METQEQKRRRLFGKQHLLEYKNMLNHLLPGYRGKLELLSIEETDKISAASSKLPSQLKKYFSFSDKEKWKEFIFENIRFSGGRYYLFTTYSSDCGALELNSIMDINFYFSINFDYGGVISLINNTLEEKVVLDFGEDVDGQYMEIEIYRNS